MENKDLPLEQANFHYSFSFIFFLSHESASSRRDLKEFKEIDGYERRKIIPFIIPYSFIPQDLIFSQLVREENIIEEKYKGIFEKIRKFGVRKNHSHPGVSTRDFCPQKHRIKGDLCSHDETRVPITTPKEK